jgi:ABC-type enterochelin transport system substrate-binding protein
MASSLTSKELLNQLSKRLDEIETHMPNGELKVILSQLEIMMDRQEKMYEDLSELKKMLLNPEDGVIVRVNKNTEYRLELEEQEQRLASIIEEHNDLKKFKSNITKFLWIILSAIIGSITMLWQRILNP